MIGAARTSVQGESPFGNLAQSEFIADLVRIKPGRHVALRNQFNEELQKFFLRSRDNRIRPFVMLFRRDYAQGGILTREKTIFPARIDSNYPQIFQNIPQSL